MENIITLLSDISSITDSKIIFENLFTLINGLMYEKMEFNSY